jgi:hypothetical protein
MRVADTQFDETVLTLTIDALTDEPHTAVGRRQSTNDTAEQRGFARPVWTDNPHNFARHDIQRYVPHRQQTAEATHE